MRHLFILLLVVLWQPCMTWANQTSEPDDTALFDGKLVRISLVNHSQDKNALPGTSLGFGKRYGEQTLTIPSLFSDSNDAKYLLKIRLDQSQWQCTKLGQGAGHQNRLFYRFAQISDHYHFELKQIRPNKQVILESEIPAIDLQHYGLATGCKFAWREPQKKRVLQKVIDIFALQLQKIRGQDVDAAIQNISNSMLKEHDMSATEALGSGLLHTVDAGIDLVSGAGKMLGEIITASSNSEAFNQRHVNGLSISPDTINAQFQQIYRNSNALITQQASKNKARTSVEQSYSRAHVPTPENRPSAYPADTVAKTEFTQSAQRQSASNADATLMARQHCENKGAYVYLSEQQLCIDVKTHRRNACSKIGGHFNSSRQSCRINEQDYIAKKDIRSDHLGDPMSLFVLPEREPIPELAAEAEPQWKERLDCGHTNFDDTMPDRASACQSAAPPAWEMFWRNNQLMKGANMVMFWVQNKSDQVIEFDLKGRVMSDTETKHFDWKGSVKPGKTFEFFGGVADLQDPAHVFTLQSVKYRSAR